MTTAIKQVSKVYWPSGAGFCVATLNVRLEDLAVRLGFAIEHYEEDGLGDISGIACQLPSGWIVLLEESWHLISVGRHTGPSITVDLGRVANSGAETARRQVLSALGLDNLALDWSSEEGAEVAALDDHVRRNRSNANATVNLAQVQWNSGQALNAGHLLYDGIPVAGRPAWAGRILEFCCSLVSDVPEEVQAVIALVDDPSRWPDAHKAFQAVRRLTLALPAATEQPATHKALLYVAENAAKVIFNATESTAPFDADCGAWLVSCLRHLIDLVPDAGIVDHAWMAAQP